jgi:hypothetical protein
MSYQLLPVRYNNMLCEVKPCDGHIHDFDLLPARRVAGVGHFCTGSVTDFPRPQTTQAHALVMCHLYISRSVYLQPKNASKSFLRLAQCIANTHSKYTKSSFFIIPFSAFSSVQSECLRSGSSAQEATTQGYCGVRREACTDSDCNRSLRCEPTLDTLLQSSVHGELIAPQLAKPYVSAARRCGRRRSALRGDKSSDPRTHRQGPAGIYTSAKRMFTHEWRRASGSSCPGGGFSPVPVSARHLS